MKFWNLLKQEHKKIRNFFWILALPLSYFWAIISKYKILKGKPRVFSNLFIIGVGNIHSGGSGKSPIVIELAEKFKNYNPIILKRAYKADLKSNYMGDEGLMMHKRLDAPQIYFTKKRLPALNDIEQNKLSKFVIIDDGYQDRTVQKNVDLVLVSDSKEIDDLFCLPYGELREPLDGLNRATALLLIKNSNQNSNWKPLLTNFRAPLFEATLKIEGLYNKNTKVILPPQSEVGAFCGIAGAERFYESLRSVVNIKVLQTFEDHHNYSQKDWESLLIASKEQGLTHLVTTEKDYWKILSQIMPQDVTLLFLRIGYDIERPFWDFIEQRISAVIT